MARKPKGAAAKLNSRSIYIGNSEIRPLASPVADVKTARPVRGTFTPGGSYQLEKFPALRNLLKKSWDQE